MNSSSSNYQSSSMAANYTPIDVSEDKKVRKPYTITKSRESWTDEEHDNFLEALQLFDRDWKKIEDFVGSKSVIQAQQLQHCIVMGLKDGCCKLLAGSGSLVSHETCSHKLKVSNDPCWIRSHAQKYFLKVQKNGTIAHVPPPRPKRKAAHAYPQKAQKNVLLPLNASMAYPISLNYLAPGYSPWDGTPMTSDGYAIGVEADIGSMGLTRFSNINIDGVGSSCRTLPTSSLAKQGKQGSLPRGIPDFAEVYSYIGSVFDPDTNGHVQKLKEMDPINFETVLLLMRNITINLSSSDFEPYKKVLSSCDVDDKSVGIDAENVGVSEQ